MLGNKFSLFKTGQYSKGDRSSGFCRPRQANCVGHGPILNKLAKSWPHRASPCCRFTPTYRLRRRIQFVTVFPKDALNWMSEEQDDFYWLGERWGGARRRLYALWRPSLSSPLARRPASGSRFVLHIHISGSGHLWNKLFLIPVHTLKPLLSFFFVLFGPRWVGWRGDGSGVLLHFRLSPELFPKYPILDWDYGISEYKRKCRVYIR